MAKPPFTKPPFVNSRHRSGWPRARNSGVGAFGVAFGQRFTCIHREAMCYPFIWQYFQLFNVLLEMVQIFIFVHHFMLLRRHYVPIRLIILNHFFIFSNFINILNVLLFMLFDWLTQILISSSKMNYFFFFDRSKVFMFHCQSFVCSFLWLKFSFKWVDFNQ